MYDLIIQEKSLSIFERVGKKVIFIFMVWYGMVSVRMCIFNPAKKFFQAEKMENPI